MTSRVKASVILQERDFALLRGLFEARVMMLTHITALHFEGKEEAAKKRVQKLKAAGYIRERKGRRAYEAAILSLTRQGFEALSAQGALAGYPAIGWKSLEKRLDVSDGTLRHEVTVLDAKAALAPAVERQPRFSITEFSVWPRLCEFTITRQFNRSVVRPDGLLRIGERGEDGEPYEHLFFLEVDRGTEEHETLVGKAVDYLYYRENGDLAARLGEEGKVHFRVLMIFKTTTRRGAPSIERRNNVAERLLLRPERFGNFVWLTTLDELLADPLGDIWVTPSAYRAATQGTPFAPEERAETAGPYVRRPERERFIEERVTKRQLLE